jgi:phosphotransferase system  glucose/maltose/N-acetylglucosamine-specific IIC component
MGKLNNYERLLGVLVGFFTWFVGGFIMSLIYRMRGEKEKAGNLRQYYLVGIFLSVLVFAGYFFLTYDNEPEGNRVTEEQIQEFQNSLPKPEDYIDREEIDEMLRN